MSGGNFLRGIRRMARTSGAVGGIAAPEVSFAIETQGAYLTSAGTVSFTVADVNLDNWTLRIAAGIGATLGAYTTLASGIAPVSGALAPHVVVRPIARDLTPSSTATLHAVPCAVSGAARSCFAAR